MSSGLRHWRVHDLLHRRLKRRHLDCWSLSLLRREHAELRPGTGTAPSPPASCASPLSSAPFPSFMRLTHAASLSSSSFLFSSATRKKSERSQGGSQAMSTMHGAGEKRGQQLPGRRASFPCGPATSNRGAGRTPPPSISLSSSIVKYSVLAARGVEDSVALAHSSPRAPLS